LTGVKVVLNKKGGKKRKKKNGDGGKKKTFGDNKEHIENRSAALTAQFIKGVETETKGSKRFVTQGKRKGNIE